MLGIDFGTARVGLATCDELEIVVTPRGVVAYSRHIVDDIVNLVETEGIERVVVGVPRTRDGTETLTVRQARNFAARLRARLPCSVDEWDESYSSQRAIERMIDANVPKKRRRMKGTTDSWSAAVILEEYIGGRARRMGS